MLPRVAIGRHRAAITADVEQYRLLVGDQLMDEVAALAKELGRASVIGQATESWASLISSVPSVARVNSWRGWKTQKK